MDKSEKMRETLIAVRNASNPHDYILPKYELREIEILEKAFSQLQELMRVDEDKDALTVAYMLGLKDGKDSMRVDPLILMKIIQEKTVRDTTGLENMAIGIIAHAIAEWINGRIK